MTFVPVQKLCVYVYIYIYIYALLYEFCFLWFTNCVLHSDDNSLIPGCLWLLAFVLNNTLILGMWRSTISHLPGCFCLWPFFQNIGFNMVPLDYFMSHLATQFGYSAGEFQALQLIWLSLQRLVSCINHLPPACWSTFWKSIYKHQVGCRFDILDSIFFCILTYAIIYVLINHIILALSLLLKYSLFFQVLIY